MKIILKEEALDIPAGVKVSCKSRVVTVEGPRGKLTKNFQYLSMQIEVDSENSKVFVRSWFASKKFAACVRSVRSQVRNMLTGVLKGFEHQMKLAYAHFPINVHIPNDGRSIEIRNYIGEREVRRINMLPGVKIMKGSDAKDLLVLQGNDLDLVSLSCALIQQSCAAKKKDIRKFLDGIYVSDRVHVDKE